MTQSSRLFLFLFLFSSSSTTSTTPPPPSTTPTPTSIDVCTLRSSKEKLTSKDLVVGVHVAISSGKVEDPEVDSSGISCVLSLRLDPSYGDLVELSFVKGGRKQVEDCFDVIYSDSEDRSNNGFSQFPCSATPGATPTGVIFQRRGVDYLKIKIHGSDVVVVGAAAVDAAVFVQQRSSTPRNVGVVGVGGFEIECPHKNKELRPNLWKGSTDLTANLTGVARRSYGVKFGAAPSPDLAGSYDCSWTAPPGDGAPPATPTTRFDVSIFANETICEIKGATGNSFLPAKISGAGSVEIPVVVGVVVEDVELTCSLAWAGNDGRLALTWRKEEEEEDNNNNEVSTSIADSLRLKRLVALVGSVNVTRRKTFRCVVEENDNNNNNNDNDKPRSCSVVFVPVPPPPEKYKGGSQGGFVALGVFIVVVVVAVVVAVLFFKRRRGSEEEASTAWGDLTRTCRGCCRGMEGMTHWGSYRTDDASVAASNPALDSLPPPNSLWSDDKNDSISMDTDFNEKSISQHPSLNSLAHSVSSVEGDPGGRTRSYRTSQI